MIRLLRCLPARCAMYLVALLAQLAWDISVSVGTWWALVQQNEAGLRRKRAR